jgi:hypothetical protein
MKNFKLLLPAIIAGQFLTAGTDVTVTDQSVVDAGYKAAKKQALRKRIEQKVGDPETLLGVVSDASAYAIDQTAMDILAVNTSADSSYKTARIRLHEEFYGADSWTKTVDFSQKWFEQRKAKQIRLPVDIKGIETVFADIAKSGIGVTNEIEAAQANG